MGSWASSFCGAWPTPLGPMPPPRNPSGWSRDHRASQGAASTLQAASQGAGTGCCLLSLAGSGLILPPAQRLRCLSRDPDCRQLPGELGT